MSVMKVMKKTPQQMLSSAIAHRYAVGKKKLELWRQKRDIERTLENKKLFPLFLDTSEVDLTFVDRFLTRMDQDEEAEHPDDPFLINRQTRRLREANGRLEEQIERLQEWLKEEKYE